MTAYNANFELTVEDVDLIETALRQSKKELSSQIIADSAADADQDHDETVRQIHDLLGRLHNQKVFYRPRRQAYVSG